VNGEDGHFLQAPASTSAFRALNLKCKALIDAGGKELSVFQSNSRNIDVAIHVAVTQPNDDIVTSGG